MKFKPGDRIIDNDPAFGLGTIISVDEDAHERSYDSDEVYYCVMYDGKLCATSSCPESEMRKFTKLDKALS